MKIHIRNIAPRSRRATRKNIRTRIKTITKIIPRKAARYLAYLNAVGMVVDSVFSALTCSNWPAGSHNNDSSHSDAHSEVSQLSAQNRVHTALEALRTQHETLMKSLQALSHIDIPSALSARASPLPSTAEEKESDYPRPFDLQSSGRFGTPFTRKSTRTSIATTFSDGTTSREWFDAFDGGEEFVLEVEPTPAEEKTNLEAEGSRSSLGGSSDAEVDEVEDIVTVGSQDKGEEVAEMYPYEKAQDVVRRTQLPSGPVGDEGSLFTLLKKNVGKVRSRLYFQSGSEFNLLAGSYKCHFPSIVQRAYNALAKCSRAAGILRSSPSSCQNTGCS